MNGGWQIFSFFCKNKESKSTISKTLLWKAVSDGKCICSFLAVFNSTLFLKEWGLLDIEAEGDCKNTFYGQRQSHSKGQNEATYLQLVWHCTALPAVLSFKLFFSSLMVPVILFIVLLAWKCLHVAVLTWPDLGVGIERGCEALGVIDGLQLIKFPEELLWIWVTAMK